MYENFIFTIIIAILIIILAYNYRLKNESILVTILRLVLLILPSLFGIIGSLVFLTYGIILLSEKNESGLLYIAFVIYAFFALFLNGYIEYKKDLN